MSRNFNVEPYYDDFDAGKHFHKILFRPSYSIQVRELTQLQSILQNQIKAMGDHLFKNGTVVIPGELSIDTNLHYVKLAQTYASVSVATYVSNLEGKTIVGGTSGVSALVVKVVPATTTTPDTLYVKYLDSGTDGTTIEFANDETLTPSDSSPYVVQTEASGATGIGSAASIKEGVYYINGNFVLAEPQTIILDAYSNTPTYSVGFNIIDSIVTPEQDETLLDNAQGSYNFAAPGAHRHYIYLELAKKTDINVAGDSDTYIQIVSLIDGVAQNVYNQTQYAEIAKVMARRTYDESGDYVVNDFKLLPREHRTNSRGNWGSNNDYIRGDIVRQSGNTYEAVTSGTSGTDGISGTWPTVETTTYNDGGVTWRLNPNPFYNGGLYLEGNEDQIALAVEPGKAYVRGFEVEKVASSYIAIPKSRQFVQVANGSMNPLVGNYVLVTNIHGIPNLSLMPKVSIYNQLNAAGGTANGTKIGTAQVRYFELHSGTIGTSTAIYKLGLFNVVMTGKRDFSREAKQFYIAGATAPESFTCDIQPILTLQNGSVTSTGTAAFTGTGTLFTSLKANDVIEVGGSLYRVTANPGTNSTVAVSPTPPTISTGLAFNLATTNVVEPENSNLIFHINNYVKSVRDGANANTISYTVHQHFTGTADGSGNIAFNLAVGEDNTFASGALVGNYVGSYGDGVIVDLQGAVTLSNNDKTATIAFGAPAAGLVVNVTATINKAGSIGTEKQKVTTVVTNTFAGAAGATRREITLAHADGIRLRSVKMRSGTFAAPTGTYSIDITSRYLFNDGQTDSYYGRCSVILADGQAAPTAPIQVTYEYFEHTGSGDYFTINSYDTSFERIGSFKDMPLGDYLDFRPRINDAGTDFTGTGGSTALLPKRGEIVRFAYDYYLARIDKLCLEPSGDFHIISGNSAVIPNVPASSPTGMALANITFAPYTVNPKEIAVNQIDNRRYTMRDIGKLENRISNLEYYTSLSFAEQNTAAMSITDELGLTRYKNGFIVDPFNGHGIGDATSPDYRCSIDADNLTLRPFHTMKNVTLYEKNTNNRSANNYRLTGDLITLPYTHLKMLDQTFASRTENVNPFAVTTYAGQLSINPEIDDWFEVKRLPDLVTNVEGNYNSLIAQYTKSGQLGTVWNAWQVAWYGKPVVTGSKSTTKVTGGVTTTALRTSVNWLYTTVSRVTTTTAKTTTTTTNTSYAQQIGQTRTGVNTQIQTKTDMQYLGDSLVSKVIIPFMRERNVAFVAEGMKAYTALNATFDEIDVNAYITPAAKMVLGGLNANAIANGIDYTSNAGSSSEHVARWIDGKLDLSLNKGMILKGQTSGATAIAIYQEALLPTPTFINVYVVNVIGTFSAGETVIGSLSGGLTGPSGTLTSITIPAQGAALSTNYAGVACGLFHIPHTSEVSFKTGERELALVDASATPATDAYATYRAQGITNVMQKSYNAIRNGTVVQTGVSADKTLTNTWSKTSSVSSTIAASTNTQVVSRRRRWSDPLAQTFLINQPGGVFITKVDLFFATKETTNSTPVHIEIRPVENGMPTNDVLPFSTVYKDPINVATSATGVTPTTFVFPSPVYLKDSMEYALVILSDSNNYTVFISNMGETDIVTNQPISTQPYLGVLFKSSNGSTWSPDQMQDLKFAVYRATFNTSVTGYVDFWNGPSETINLDADPFHITNGSALVRVSHPDHNMPVGSTVTLSGSTDVGSVLAASLTGDFVISNVDLDSYTITMAAAATESIIGGGADVYASENHQFNTLLMNAKEMTLQGTGVSYQVKTTSGQSVDGSETAYSKDVSWSDLTVNDNMVFDNPRMIASRVNETVNMAGAHSMEVLATLTSELENISPVLDTQQLSLTTISNKINAPTKANINVAVIDDREVINVANVVGFDATTSSLYCDTADTTSVSLLSTITPGKYINISGDVTDVPTTHVANNGDWLVTGVGVSEDETQYVVTLSSSAQTVSTVAPNTNNTIVISQYERFIDEICPMYGTSYNKYLSREILLANPSTFMKISLAVSCPYEADVAIYYRTNSVGDATPLNTQTWTRANPNSGLLKNTNGSFVDTQFDVSDIPSFDAMQVKIVLTSTSTSNVPMCKDLRIIACA